MLMRPLIWLITAMHSNISVSAQFLGQRRKRESSGSKVQRWEIIIIVQLLEASIITVAVPVEQQNREVGHTEPADTPDPRVIFHNSRSRRLLCTSTLRPSDRETVHNSRPLHPSSPPPTPVCSNLIKGLRGKKRNRGAGENAAMQDERRGAAWIAFKMAVVTNSGWGGRWGRGRARQRWE